MSLFSYLRRRAGGNRVDARQLTGSVVVGGNSGLIYVVNSAGPMPAPPILPREDLPQEGAPFETFNLLSWKCRLARGRRWCGRPGGEQRSRKDTAPSGARVQC